MNGVFNAPIFKGTNPTRQGVQYGPLEVTQETDPVERLVRATMGHIPVEPNGIMHLDPNKIEYLKS